MILIDVKEGIRLSKINFGVFYDNIANLMYFRTVKVSILFESQASKHMQTSFHNPFF